MFPSLPTCLSLLVAVVVLQLTLAEVPGQASKKANDKIPVKEFKVADLVRHFPDWESVVHTPETTTDIASLGPSLGNPPVLDVIETYPGTEAATAPYEAGRLLLIEFASPEGSIDADGKIKAKLAESPDPTVVYRRIGNYNAFVFHAKDPAAANALLDRITYGKAIQWVPEAPDSKLHRSERNFVTNISDLFLSTFFIVLLWIAVAILGGVVAGYLIFQTRERKRASMMAFSDAGGMTRLNLDTLTPDIAADRLLKE